MNLRWMFFDHVPPGITLTADERREMMKRAGEYRFRARATRLANLQWILVVSGASLISMVIIVLIMVLFFPLAELESMRLAALASNPLVVAVVFWLAIAGYYHISHAPHVRRALNDMGHPVCIACGYALRDLPENTTKCPECGAARGERFNLSGENTSDDA